MTRGLQCQHKHQGCHAKEAGCILTRRPAASSPRHKAAKFMILILIPITLVIFRFACCFGGAGGEYKKNPLCTKKPPSWRKMYQKKLRLKCTKTPPEMYQKNPHGGFFGTFWGLCGRFLVHFMVFWVFGSGGGGHFGGFLVHFRGFFGTFRGLFGTFRAGGFGGVYGTFWGGVMVHFLGGVWYN